MIWEDFEDDCYLNTMLRLVILLNKPLLWYYCDDEYFEGLNNMNIIIGMNIYLFIIESPAPNCREVGSGLNSAVN